MPTKRTRVGRYLSSRISPEAVEAYRAGDYIRLHRALALPPWHASPLPIDISPLGVRQGEIPALRKGSAWAGSWPAAQELQLELEAALQGSDGPN